MFEQVIEVIPTSFIENTATLIENQHGELIILSFEIVFDIVSL